MMRDSVGPVDVVIGVQVDSLCRFGKKRIVTDFPGSCATMALRVIGAHIELELMKMMRFQCEVGEQYFVVRCEHDD